MGNNTAVTNEYAGEGGRKGMHPAVRAVYFLLIIVFLILPVPLNKALGREADNEEAQNNEMRTMAEKPPLNWYTIPGFPIAYEAWFSDALPFKDELVKTGSLLDYYVFRSSMGDKVLIGKEGWLFYKDSQVNSEDPIADYEATNLYGEAELAEIAEKMVTARDELASRGISFAVMIAPSKERANAEYIPDRYGEPGAYSRMAQIGDYLREHTDLTVVTPYSALAEYKAAHPDAQLYYKYDTHWNNLGAYIGAKALNEALGIEGMPEPEDLQISYGDPPVYDLARLLDLGEELKDDRPVILDNAVRANMDYWTNGKGTEYRYKNLDGTGDPRKIFIVGDSFSTMMSRYVAPSFRELYLNFYYNYNLEMLEEEAPDLVVYEVVERYVDNMRHFSITEGVDAEAEQ